MSVEPDNKLKYVKLLKNTIIASVLITLALSLLEIPKSYFGTPVGIADEGTSDITFAKIEDKDCQNREIVNIDGKRYVVTDSNKTIAALTDNDSLHEAFGLYSAAKVVENVSYLRLFNDCQGFWKGYYANIDYYRDTDGFIFPSSFTYQDYINHKENNSFGRRWWTMKKTVKIPSQIKLQTEFFEGYGMAELIKSIIVLGISSAIAYCIYKITKTTLLATFLVIGSTAISVVFVTKNRNGFSHIGTSDWYYTTKARPLQGFHVKQRVLFLEICGCRIWPYHILWRRFRVSHETTLGCFSGVFHMKHINCEPTLCFT